MPLYALVFMSSPWPMSSARYLRFVVNHDADRHLQGFDPTATLATTGVILSAAYALWLYRKVVFGALVKPRWRASRI